MVFDPGESEDIRSAVLDRYGPGILHLEQIERQLGDKLLSLNSRLDDAAQSITVIEKFAERKGIFESGTSIGSQQPEPQYGHRRTHGERRQGFAG